MHLSSSYTIFRRDLLKISEKGNKTGRRKSRRKNFPVTVPAVGRTSLGCLLVTFPRSQPHPEPSREVPSVCPVIQLHPPPYIALSTFSDLAPGDIEVSEESLVPKKKKYLEFGCDFLQAS